MSFSQLMHADFDDVIHQIGKGLPLQILSDASAYLNVPKTILRDILYLNVSSSSANSHKKRTTRFSSHESDRIARLARVTKAVETLMDDREAAVEWFITSVPALNGRTPLEYLGTDAGAKLVEDMAFRAVAGVYS